MKQIKSYSAVKNGAQKRIRRFTVVGGLLAVAGIATVLGTTHPTAADTSTTPQLVAHWMFDNIAQGSDALDSIGTNTAIPNSSDSTAPLPSTNVPPVSFTDTNSMQFDGSNYFTINNPVTTDFSICAWINTTSTGGGVQHWTSAPIMDSEVGGVAYDFGFGIGNGGKLMFGNGGVEPGNNPATTSANWDAQVNGSTTINDGEWHNVCVTRDGTTGEDILYVDAAVDGSGFTGIGTQTANPHARIGWGYDGAALYQGFIDDVRVYDGVLTQDQLQNLTDGSDNPSLAPGDDGDGISATVEDAAPNGGDANNDGTADGQQANVASFVNSISNAYASVAVNDACSLSGVTAESQATAGADAGYSYPMGLVNFTADCGTNGFATTVTQYFYNPPAGNFVLRKYSNGSYQTISDATITRTTIGGQPVLEASYSVTDGGALDNDGTENGIIVDPVGLALADTPGAPNTGLLYKGILPYIIASIIGTGLLVGSAIIVRRRLYGTVNSQK